MREFVYLSDNKLRQFIDPGPRRRWWPSSGKVSLSLPVGSMEVQQDATQGRRLIEQRLGAVDAHVDLAARWYADEDVGAGDWVAFEVPLLYSLLEPLVLFVDPLNPRDVRQTRLLLHGSASSMRPDLWEDAQQSPGMPHQHSEASFVYEMEGAFRSLHFVQDPLRHGAEPSVDPERRLRRSVARVIATLDNNFSPVTAAWMRGVARVSVRFPAEPSPEESGELVDESPSTPGAIVVASPLYVERAPLPAI